MIVDQEQLTLMLSRLKLTTIRDKLDNFLDEAARKEMTLREAVYFLCKQEVESKDQKRIRMGISIAKFGVVQSRVATQVA